MAASPTLQAARDLLGTITGARAALDALAANHLPPGRVMALHRESDRTFDHLAEAEEQLHRRMEHYRRVLQAGVTPAEAPRGPS